MFVALTAVSSLVSIGVSVLLVVILSRGLQGMIEGQFVSQGATLGMYLLLTAPQLRYRFSLTSGRELLSLGLPVIPGFAFLFVILQGNKYVLQWFHGLEATGVYTIGFDLGLGMGILVSAFSSAWLPYFMSFRDKQQEAQVLFGRILIYYVLGFGALSLLFFIVAKPVVMIMTQPAFHEAYKAVGFSAGAHFLAGIFSILLPGVYFAKQIKNVTLVQAGAALLAIGLDLLMIPPFGVLGAAVALIIGTLAMVVLQQAWNVTRKHDFLRVDQEWSRILTFSVVYVAYAVLMLWEREFSLPAEVVISIVGVIVLLPVLYSLLNISERQFLAAIVKPLRPAWFQATGENRV
jgi:O-antigen/teichoic acid export membrane protein